MDWEMIGAVSGVIGAVAGIVACIQAAGAKRAATQAVTNINSVHAQLAQVTNAVIQLNNSPLNHLFASPVIVPGASGGAGGIGGPGGGGGGGGGGSVFGPGGTGGAVET